MEYNGNHIHLMTRAAKSSSTGCFPTNVRLKDLAQLHTEVFASLPKHRAILTIAPMTLTMATKIKTIAVRTMPRILAVLEEQHTLHQQYALFSAAAATGMEQCTKMVFQ